MIKTNSGQYGQILDKICGIILGLSVFNIFQKDGTVVAEGGKDILDSLRLGTTNTTVFFPLLNVAIKEKSLHVFICLKVCLWCQIAEERMLNKSSETCMNISRMKDVFWFTVQIHVTQKC